MRQRIIFIALILCMSSATMFGQYHNGNYYSNYSEAATNRAMQIADEYIGKNKPLSKVHKKDTTTTARQRYYKNSRKYINASGVLLGAKHSPGSTGFALAAALPLCHCLELHFEYSPGSIFCRDIKYCYDNAPKVDADAKTPNYSFVTNGEMSFVGGFVYYPIRTKYWHAGLGPVVGVGTDWYQRSYCVYGGVLKNMFKITDKLFIVQSLSLSNDYNNNIAVTHTYGIAIQFAKRKKLIDRLI